MSPEASEALDATWDREQPELLAEHADARVYHGSWRQLLNVAPMVDALIVDAPYSERTHAANDGSATRDPSRMPNPEKLNRALNYACWSESDVRDFVSGWSPLVGGWFVSITDHSLARTWEQSLLDAGRYVFAPLAFTWSGSRIRLAGDGPSNWTTWIVVARPRTKEAAKWGTLPGAYVLPPGYSERMAVVGGKPLWLMERLVEDYSRSGALVCDPCCGAGTTLVAAQRTGRRAIGGDVLREHAELAARRISKPSQQPLFGGL